MTPDQISTIVARSQEIEGWFSRQAAFLFGWIDEIQRQHAIDGDIVEIGAHHGKSATLLGAMARRGERLTVCDLFGNQAENLSRSGRGDRERFEANMAELVQAGLDLRVIAKNSLDMSAAEVGSGVRFFHIDGGHHCREALSDLRLAAATLVEGGVILIDDPFNLQFPGVTEAIIRFLDERADYCALTLGFNKMLLAPRAASAIYLAALNDKAQQQAYGIEYPISRKTIEFHDAPLLVFFIPHHLQRQKLMMALRDIYQNHGWLQQPPMRPLVSLSKRIVGMRAIRQLG